MNNFYLKISLMLGSLFLVSLCLFSVDQRQSAVLFQFGEAKEVITSPGLHFKMPLIQDVIFFDNRILHLDSEAKELTASDGKRIIVDAFTKFKITNPVVFYTTVLNDQGVKIRLNKILESSMRKVIGRVPLTSLLTGERTNIMTQIHEQVNEEAKNFGIQIVDVRIRRADLPKENSAAIYSRMQTEREKEAKQIRAEGNEEAERIRAKADKECQILKAEAYKTSQIIKGNGDAEAAKIFNLSFASDPEFYKFYKSLAVYRKSLNKNNTFIMSSDAEFLKYLNLGK